MSSQQVGELYYKVGVKGLQEALKDLDKLYEKSGKGPSSSSPFNLGPVDKSGATIKSVAEARKHLQELAQGIGVDLNKVVSQIGNMPDLMIKNFKARGVSPAAAYGFGDSSVHVVPGATTRQNLKHELMHAIEQVVPKGIFSSIVSEFSPIRQAEIAGRSAAYQKDRMMPSEVFASFMERQSPDVIRALIGSDMTTKVAALAGDAAARAVVRATTVNRTAPVTLAGGFGEGVSVDSRYGRGSRVVSATTTLPASSLSRQGRPDPNDFGATVSAPSSGDYFGAGVLTPAQKAKATAAANAANARASQVQANIAAFMGSNHGGFAGGGGFGGGGGPGGGVPPNIPPANPWLPTISTMTRDEHNNLVARAASASAMANELTGQIRGNGPGGINERLDKARLNVLEEEDTPGSTGSTITARQNELLDLEEQRLHVAGRYADIEQAVNNTLGTQVSYANKIVEAEEAALKYAKQRNELPLSAAQEAAIKKGARAAEEANLIGGVGGSAQKNLEDARTRLKNLQDARAGATAENAPLIDKAIRETRALIDLEARRLRIAQELAVIENKLATDPSLTHGSRRRLEKSAEFYREELKAANAQSENAGRSLAKDKSKLSNYRLQELSYGVQDFAQVLSGGGGLDAALRASNNNISQFYAAAGGANAARNSMVATLAILGIAGALKLMADAADAPAKKMEELFERMKELQGLSREIIATTRGGTVGFGDVGGGSASNVGATIGSLQEELRNARVNRNAQLDIFAMRSEETPVKTLKSIGSRALAAAAMAIDLPMHMENVVKGERGLLDGVEWKRAGIAARGASDVAVERAFYERFAERKSASQIAMPAFTLDPHYQRQMSAILKSKDTTSETGADVAAAIKDMGGWAGHSAESLKAMTDNTNRVKDIMKRIEFAGEAYARSIEETAANLRLRNSLLAGGSGQSQSAARADDVVYINQQNSIARQRERDAEEAKKSGLMEEAKTYTEDAEKARSLARMRMREIAPGTGRQFSGQALSLESTLAPFQKQMQDAIALKESAKTLPEQIEAARQIELVKSGRENATDQFLRGFKFQGRKSGDSFAEADNQLSMEYQQLVSTIERNHGKNSFAANAAIEALDLAKKREEDLRASSRLYESDVREAKAYGTSFDEQRAAIEQSRNERLANVNEQIADPAARKRARDEVNRAANRDLEQNLKQQERSRLAANNMFAGDAAGLMGGRAGQHYSNAASLETKLNAIKDLEDNLGFSDDAKENARIASEKRQQAQSLFEEQKKQIEQKQVGFSDIGGMWKQIQMSLKPDKSIEMQKIANDHLDAIRKLAEGAGLKMQIPLGA